MSQALKEFLRTFIVALALVGIAEVFVQMLDAPRLWALVSVFAIGYFVIAVFNYQRRRAKDSVAGSHGD